MARRANGEGLLRKRANGTWEGRVPIGRTPEGKIKYKCVYAKTQAEVKKKADVIKKEMKDGKYSEPSKMPFGKWLDIWLEEYKRNEIKKTTYIGYINRLNNHIKPCLGQYPIRDLRTDTIQSFINGLNKNGLAAETIRGIYNAIHASLEQAVDNELISRNVSNSVKLPKINKKEVKVLTVEEQNRFINIAKEHYLGEIFILNLATGLRIGETLSLQWKDIDFGNDILRVNSTINIVKDYDDSESKWHKEFGTPKTKSSIRSIPLLPNIVTMLKLHKIEQAKNILTMSDCYEKNDLVFATKLGLPLDPRNMWKIFKDIIDKAEIKDVSIHSTRHTFATRGLENGIELVVMKELLGHSSIKMTADLYTHVLPDKKFDSIMKLKDTIFI